MPTPLIRLLRLRTLLEDSSRVELERHAALVARIGRAQEREQQSIRSSRAQALLAIRGEGPAIEHAQQRTAEWMNLECAAWREKQLQPLAQAAAGRLAERREEFFERRKERQQVETVLEAERTQRKNEQERRTQRELDDWFGMKQVRNRRRSI